MRASLEDQMPGRYRDAIDASRLFRSLLHDPSPRASLLTQQTLPMQVVILAGASAPGFARSS